MRRDFRENSADRRLIPALAFVAMVTAVPCAAFYIYQDMTGPKAYIKRMGYSHVSLGARTAGACDMPYFRSQRFTAQDRTGRQVNGIYCSSNLFGEEIQFETALAAADPAIAPPPSPP